MKKNKASFSNSKRKAPKLNITSLMDALTIILIFLLVNYSDQPEERDLPKFVNLPKLSGKQNTEKKMDIQLVIGKNQIKVGKDLDFKYANFDAEIDTITKKVTDELKAIRKRVVAGIEDKEKQKKFTPKITVQADQDVEFSDISKLIKSAASEGMNIFDFVTINNK